MRKNDLPIDRLGQVLDKSLKRLDLSPRLDEYGVWPIWNETVGPTIARNAQPEKIRNGTLFVKVTSPVWMQQLQYMKEMIVEKLNQRLKTDIVKNIFFVVGRVNVEIVEIPSKPAAPSSVAVEEPQLGEDFLESVRTRKFAKPSSDCSKAIHAGTERTSSHRNALSHLTLSRQVPIAVNQLTLRD